MGSLADEKRKEMVHTLSDPFVIELKRLENNLREKEWELGAANNEIKALKVTELLKEKAVVELSNELEKLEMKLINAEKHVEDKKLEIKKLTNEKKDLLAAQFAVEATLRRVHANQKDEESVPVEAIIAPYESDIRKYKIEIASLQEDKKALERLIKSKDVALVEADRRLLSAEERALTVEALQNQNIELKRQIEICQEENRLLEKSNRHKVVEVEKLSQTIRELEESILAGGALANVVRDHQRQLSEINEEKKTLERELARAKVSAHRVATAVANEWKDEGDKVINVKQWMEERKFLQGEIQRLRDKLIITERTAKAESQLRDKYKLRLKVLEGSLKCASTSPTKIAEKPEKAHGFQPCIEGPRKRSTSQPRPSVVSARTLTLQQPVHASGVDSTRRSVQKNSSRREFISGDNPVKKNLNLTGLKFLDESEKENTDAKINSNGHAEVINHGKFEVPKAVDASECDFVTSQIKDNLENGSLDMVSGILYDRLQKELINSRKLHEQKDGVLNAKDDEIKLLNRKIDALSKAMEIEAKKIRREAAAKGKETLKTSNISPRCVKSPNSTTSRKL